MFEPAQQGENAVMAEAGPMAGERALMRAVLEDAIRCLVGEVGPRYQRGRLAAEARAWIEGADPHWHFSFENLCDGLGLDSGRLRARLLRDAPVPVAVDGRQLAGRGVRPPRETPAEDQIVQMIRAGRPRLQRT